MSEVWCKGDNCLAPWSNDGKLYEGLVRKIIRRQDGQVCAKVRYHGFGPEEEEVEISRLQKSPILHIGSKPQRLTASELNSGIFRPLTGIEEDKRIREKFTRLEAEEKCQDFSLPPASGPAQRSKKRSYGPIFDSQEPSTSREPVPSKTYKKSGVDQLRTSSETQFTGRRSPAPRGNSARETVSKKTDNAQTSSSTGFTDDDMEKPKFAFSAVTAKVQFKLCEEEPVYAIPASINQYLRDYQRDGVKFLYENYTQKTGAILGDDMGLGKTVQVIAFLSALLRKQGNREDVMRLKPKFIRELSDTERLDDPAIHKPFLIIGPGSVLYNWLDELETWGYFTARKYHGSDKFQTLAEVKKEKIEIVVTTYETFRDNVDELNSVKWCAVIVDEVHRIKGLTSQTTAALRKIHTPCRFGLTGTALQNNVTELWSILDWARPGFLGNLKSFETEFVRRIERGQKHDATKRELAEARKMKETFANLRSKMMLRRTKKLIADQLPEKDDNIVFSKLTTLQVDVYKAILNHPDMRLILSMEDPCQCGSQKPQVKCCRQTSSDGTPVRNLMFTYMSLLMKTANHVALLIPNKTTSEGQRKHAKEICEIAFAKHPQFVSQASEASFRTLSDPKYCGKMKILKGLLSVFRKKHNKILLFSYSTKLLSIVEQYVISVGYEYRRIDGSVSSKKRMDIVREFNNDKNIFICLISTKAGGLGLNLTGANVVIIFDPNWNPSYDLQAQDRAYRIGQRRNVQVFRLVSAGTIEENIYLRQVYKQQLDTVAVEMGNAKRYFHGIQGDKHNKGELFGLKNMFKLQTGEHCLTMDILKRNENLEAGLKNFDIVEYLPCSNESQESDSGGITDGAGGQSSEDSSDEFGGLMDMFLDQQSREDGDQEEGTGRSREKTVANFHARTHKSSRDDENSVPKDASAGTLRGDNSVVREPPSSTSEPGLQSKLNKSKGKGPGKRKTAQFVDKGESLPGSFGSVAEVLDHCGVLHVHKNPQMIGSSRAEDHMSRCAIQDVFELHVNSQIPAIQCPPLSQPSDSEESDTAVKKPAKVSKSHGPSYNQSCARSIGSTRILIGQTPKAIKREQFEKLAAFMNCGSETDFAEQVLSMSVTQRVELLNSFYHTQQQELFPLFTVEPVPEQTPPRSRSVKEKVSESTPHQRSKKNHPKVRRKQVKLGLIYDSSEESCTSEIPANMIGETNTPIPSTSHDDGNQPDFDELILGAKSLPRRSPAQRKSVKTRPRKRKETVPDASVLSEFGETFPDKCLLESWTCETDSRVTKRFTRTCESIPVENLLEEMISAKPDENVDRHKGSAEVKTDSDTAVHQESSSNKFALLDDIFLTEIKTSAPKRKPPPSASRKQKKGLQAEVRTETLPAETLNNSPSLDDQLNPSRDLFESLQVTPDETLKTKAFGMYGDESKWKRRDRKRACPKKTVTVSEKVDKLINKGNEDYKALFVSGKMRKLAHSQLSENGQDGEVILSTPKEPDSVMSPSLFSGR